MIIELEEPFKSLYRKGYLRTESDGRRYLSLYNAPGDQRSISYARYLYSVKIGYEVPQGIEIDHSDGDKTNDDINNLIPMTEEMHRNKTYVMEREKEIEVELTCANCEIEFSKPARYVRDKASQGQTKFYCSNRCSSAGKRPPGTDGISDDVKNSIKDLRGKGLSSYKISDELKISRNTVMKYW
jgi:hypothetical protein